MTEITYIVNHPIKLSDHFEIPMDQSKWDGTSYEKKGDNTVPVRDRIIHFKNLLIPKTNYAQKYCTAGLYLMFFNDFKKFYVGIATKHAKTPEGILKRIRKHRAKATATYQITQSINHTEEEPYGWRSLAKARYKKYGNKDQLEDCYLVTINPKDHENLVEDEKNKLWFIENLISSNEHDVIKKILSLIPGDNLLKDWVSFNDINTGTAHKHKFVYNFE